MRWREWLADVNALTMRVEFSVELAMMWFAMTVSRSVTLPFEAEG